jgi:hypothetical protein
VVPSQSWYAAILLMPVQVKVAVDPLKVLPAVGLVSAAAVDPDAV